MSKNNINKLHKALTLLFMRSPEIAGTNVTVLTNFGEVLTIQLDGSYVVQYAQGKIPEITFPQSMFWRYSDDAFVDATANLPDYVWADIENECSRLRESYVDVVVENVVDDIKSIGNA